MTKQERQVLMAIRASRGAGLAEWAEALLPSLIDRGLVKMVPAVTDAGDDALEDADRG